MYNRLDTFFFLLFRIVYFAILCAKIHLKTAKLLWFTLYMDFNLRVIFIFWKNFSVLVALISGLYRVHRGCVNRFNKVPTWASSLVIKKHNKTKNCDKSLNPKKLQEQTFNWSTPVFVLNDPIFGEFDPNILSNIVLKYIPYKNCLSGDIPICWPSYYPGYDL